MNSFFLIESFTIEQYSLKYYFQYLKNYHATVEIYLILVNTPRAILKKEVPGYAFNSGVSV